MEFGLFDAIFFSVFFRPFFSTSFPFALLIQPFIFIWLWASRHCQRFALFISYHFHLCSAHCKLQAEIAIEWVDCMRNKTISMLLIFALKFFPSTILRALYWIVWRKIALCIRALFNSRPIKTCKDVERERHQFIWLLVFFFNVEKCFMNKY